jgi:hypothetical protein
MNFDYDDVNGKVGFDSTHITLHHSRLFKTKADEIQSRMNFNFVLLRCIYVIKVSIEKSTFKLRSRILHVDFFEYGEESLRISFKRIKNQL